MLQYEKDKEKAAFKEMTWKQRFEHIHEYYRLPILIGIVLIAIGAWALNHYVINPPKDPSVNITVHSYLIDVDQIEVLENQYREVFSDFEDDSHTFQIVTNSVGLDEAGTNAEQEYAAVIKMMAMLEAKSIDVLVGDYDAMASDAFNTYMMPLDEVFTEEELARIEELGYVQEDADSSIIWMQQGDMDEDGNQILLDARPFFVDISGNLEMRTAIAGEATYVGFAANTPNLERAKEVFWYLLTGERS